MYCKLVKTTKKHSKAFNGKLYFGRLLTRAKYKAPEDLIGNRSIGDRAKEIGGSGEAGGRREANKKWCESCVSKDKSSIIASETHSVCLASVGIEMGDELLF